MATCKLCGKVLSTQEVTAYRERCEDCWCYPCDKVDKHGRLLPKLHGIASYYTTHPIGDAGEVTNQDVEVL